MLIDCMQPSCLRHAKVISFQTQYNDEVVTVIIQLGNIDLS
jgi:hypothetical protein